MRLGSLVTIQVGISAKGLPNKPVPRTLGVSFGTAISGVVPAGVTPGVYITGTGSGSLDGFGARVEEEVDLSPYNVRVVSINGVAPTSAYDAYRLVNQSGGRVNLVLFADGGELESDGIYCGFANQSFYGPDSVILPGFPSPF